MGRRMRTLTLGLTLILGLALIPGAAPGLASLQPQTADPAAAGTAPPRPAPVDTVPVDTVPTARARALERLRALPTSPIRPDTAAAEQAEGEEEASPREPEAEAPTPAEAPGPPVPGAPAEVIDGAAAGADTGRRDTAQDEAAIRSLLLALPGYSVTEYEGQEGAVFERSGNRLNLRGESRVAQAGSAMSADSALVYSGDSSIVCGYGSPVLTGDEGEPVSSQQVCYDINRRLGMAERAQTKLVHAGTWYVRGGENRVWVWNDTDQHRIYGEKAEFTSCELDEPHYSFHARSLKMVQEDVWVARNVTLRFGDVPVFWLPWMVQSLKPDRRSGLLTPQFGVNDIVRNSTGYNRRISNLGFYWAVNDYVSALVAGEWFSNNYSSLEGSLTYAWTRQFLQGRLALRQYWHNADQAMGRRDLTISTSNSWRPDERTQVQVSGDYSTSTSLVRDYSFDPRELNRNITSQASMNRSFDWGSVSMGAQRRQRISDDQVDWTLPSFNLNLRPMTFFAGDDGIGGVTWSGRGTVNRTLREVNQVLTPRAQGQETVNASASHSVSLGRLSLSQQLQYRDQTQQARPFHVGEGGIIEALPQTSDQDLGWSTSLSFQQTLWPGTTLSPNLSIRGRQVRDERTQALSGTRDFIAEPNRVSAGASLGTTVFGFWPGFGEYERIRHRISPTLNWSYSPTPSTTELQDSIFRVANLREQNRISLSFNQTFEGRVRDSGGNGQPAPGSQAGGQEAGVGAGEAAARPGETGVEPGETGTGDGVAAADDGGAHTTEQDGEVDRSGEPRRMPPTRTVNLLSIHTNTSFDYDFVSARETGRGFQTTDISNSIRSDLVPGLQLSMSHSLFEEGAAPDDGGLRPRSFRPYLTRLSTSFSIDQDFWLFRMLGLDLSAGDNGDPEGQDAGDPDGMDQFDLDDRDPGAGSMVPRAGGPGMGGAPASGWRATVDYSLNRRRPTPGAPTAAGLSQQTVRGNLSFRPTEHWSVNWSTSYSFTTGEFDSHVLNLARDLHRWQANFDFIRNANGNFAMQFRVHLLDNPDLKVEYDQRTDPSDRLYMRQP